MEAFLCGTEIGERYWIELASCVTGCDGMGIKEVMP